MIRIGVFAGREECRCPDNFALLVMIDSQAGFGEACRSSVADLDKYKAFLIEHDQVDFTAARAEVARDGAQPLVDEKAKGVLLGAVA